MVSGRGEPNYSTMPGKKLLIDIISIVSIDSQHSDTGGEKIREQASENDQ